MESTSLKSRAIAFAFCIGAVSFILTLVTNADRTFDTARIAQAVTIAIICSIMSWASAERAVASVAEAVDRAIARLTMAAHGDLLSPTPSGVRDHLPHLADALDGLFRQTRSNLESVNTLAMYDPVTSLANRLNFRREADRMLQELAERDFAALLFIDLDHFKAVNDTLGHAQGDQLLGKVANRLRAVAEAERESNPRPGADPLIGRLAGDEFTMLLPGLNDRSDAERVARRVLFALGEPFDIAGQQVDIGASIGIALRPEHGRSLTALMKAADIAMYHAKSRGRSQSQFYSEELAETLAERSQLEKDLRHGIAQKQFSLVFQPQLQIAGDGPPVCEALLRWHHPVLGDRLPGDFIPAAEETGLIIQLGDWVIDNVGRTLSNWASLGLQHRIAINISPRQLERAGFVHRIRQSLAVHMAPPHLLELELTESLAMKCPDDVLADLASLRADGTVISIDDFGTGFSNLGRMLAMPVDRVKLDRCLVDGITRSEEARTIAHAVIGLIHGLGYQAVAEGVESEEQLAMLKAMGCDAVQGYAVAVPMDEDALIRWLAARHQAAS